MGGSPGRRAKLYVAVPVAAAAVLVAVLLGSPAAAQEAPAKPNCGATQIPKSVGGYWQCSFSDDFEGSTLDRTKWVPQESATSGYVNGLTACFVDDPDNVSVSDGNLNLTARKEERASPCGSDAFTTPYTSGMVTTAGLFSQTYGRFEVRARISPAKVKGLQTTFWLWPTDAGRYGPYPASGEIDIAEMYSSFPDRAIPYIHYNPAVPDPNVTNNFCMIDDPSAFQSYTLEWTPISLKVIYDGKTCLEDVWVPAPPLTKPQPFDQPFFVALTQALGVGTNAFDPATTPLPATTQVDYIHVWE